MTQRKSRSIYFRFIVGILMPVFLSMLVPQYALGQGANLLQITFQIKQGASLDAVSSRFGITPVRLFGSTFKTQISSDELASLRLAPEINYANPDSKVGAFGITISQTVTDPFFTVDSTDLNKQWYLPKIKIPEVWDIVQGSSATVVAIIDTGIHATHLELNDGRIIDGFNTITNQAIPANSNSDDNGHGTAVAGVIGAIPNNGKGIAGINWNVKIMPIKALAADGTGDLSAVAAGITWATDHGANIINLSIGGNGFNADPTLSDAVAYAFNHNVLIVAAAGNDLADQGLNLDSSPGYPICADNGQNMVLGVAATDANDIKADFSNFGYNCVDISAPGQRILTTAFFPNEPSDNVLVYGSGTSLSTPIVSGVAALLKSSNVNLTNVDLRNILMKSSDNIDPLNQINCSGGSCNGFLGKGRVNALSAVIPLPITDGSLVREALTGTIYFINNNVKREVPNFVFSQRGFSLDNVATEINNQLSKYLTGLPLPPLEGTLIKSLDDPQVYIINQELKRPVTYLVFISRGYKFSDIKTIFSGEINKYATGNWYWPPDGTMVLVEGNPLVYVMDQQIGRPVTYFVFTQRHLSFAKVIRVTTDEFTHVPQPQDRYWLPPPDGTLVKSSADPGIYRIENGVKRLLSYGFFISARYSFSSVKTLPPAEIDVIAPGAPVL